MIADMAGLTDREVLAAWVASLEELRRRGIVRSANNPTGDYAERLVIDALGFTQPPNSEPGYDAIGPSGETYQIKSRRLTSPTTSRQLSPMRNLERDDPKPFDHLIIVLFGPAFGVLECWQVPIEAVREHARYRPHVNGYVLHARGAVLTDPRTTRINLLR